MSAGMRSWFAIAFEPAIRLRALRVAVIVGTVLVAINHLDALLVSDWTVRRALQIALTYCVPYCVSTWSSVQALRSARID